MNEIIQLVGSNAFLSKKNELDFGKRKMSKKISKDFTCSSLTHFAQSREVERWRQSQGQKNLILLKKIKFSKSHTTLSTKKYNHNGCEERHESIYVVVLATKFSDPLYRKHYSYHHRKRLMMISLHLHALRACHFHLPEFMVYFL